MVKADYNRDYYADLDLPQNADVNEVKKQFRKLALKYHPDRNPGREAEVNAKFQTIQAAHEILTSPEQRSKYDAQRSRRFPGASNVKGNPWADAGKNFPPPPQRNRPNASSASSRPAGTASSADRYAKFPNHPPPMPPRPTEDPQSRAEAFVSMRPKPKHRAPTAPHPGVHTGSSSSGASTRTRPPDTRQTAYTASQQKKAEASFGNRTGRSSRSGFVPGSTMGDEPPVASSNYSSSRRHTSLFDEAAAPPPVPPRERADYGAASGADDGFPPNLDPRSSPYQTRSGERLDPFEGGTSVNRAKSTRESHRRAQDDPDHFTTPNRQRSFSVSDEPEGTKYPATEPRQANISRKATANTGNIPDSARVSRFGDHFSSSNAGPGMPAASSAGYGYHDGSAPPTTSGAAADGSHGSRAFRDNSGPHPNVYDVADPTTHPSSFPFEAPPARPMPAASATVSIDRHSHSVWNGGSKRLSSGGRSMCAYSDLNVFEQKQFDLLDKLVRKEPMHKGETGSARGSQSKETGHPPESLSHLNTASRYHRYKETDKFNNYSFPQNPKTGVHADAAEPSSFARNSAESINTRFVPDEHTNVNWQFNAGGDFSPSTNGAGSRRAQSGSRLGRRSPTKGRSRMAGMAAGATAATAAGMAAAGAFRNVGSGSEGSSEDEGVTSPTRTEKRPSPQQDQSGFDADIWSDKIGSEHFVPVPPSRGSGSPSRPPMRPPKRRPTVRMTKGGSAGLVEEEDITSGEDRAGGVAVDGMDSSNAMDIDTPMGEPTAVPQAAAANGVRGVPVEPSRPEWRAGDANGFATTAPPTAVPASDAPVVKPRFNVSNAAGSEDTDELRAGFDDLKKVEPIAQRAAGLNSFDDLKTHLPFESRASVNPPIEKTKGTQETSINFPKPPVPPRAPAPLAISGLKPSGSAWEAHVHEFEIYLREWDNFNSKFVDHVLARQNQLNKAKQKNGLSLLYTLNVKSTQEYASWLEQDQLVHEKWTAYHNEHLKRVREFMAHQEKMKE
ncbi:hypothetical protein PpBr36_01362 [Pyricularia pennisetigena]|uniref:hypothetical protein n=1 Tax=Pyricularia pennisetigena TaxID=1578925 RepID=UPI00114F58E5|nr:hypothetical protein PpBr36_01362 [Pyricularia pennisetigena]TLS29462.1 hypothetical protein PpBr36_01362 [Pyricularia pennisetigena]